MGANALTHEQLEQVEAVVRRLMGEQPRPLTVKEFAEANNIGLTQVYVELNSGRLKGFKVATKTLILPEDGKTWRAQWAQYQPNPKLNKTKGGAQA